MQHPLDGARLKVVRAEQHLDSVKEIVRSHQEKCCVVHEQRSDSANFSIKTSFPDPPEILSAIIGDCLHNLRSSLDHMVWQLILFNGATPTKKTMLPICLTLKEFKEAVGRKRIEGVSRNAFTFIESLQPYQAGHSAKKPHKLALLNELVNIDKHHTLVLTSSLARNLQLASKGLQVFNYGIHGNGAEIMMYDPVAEPALKQMEVKIKDGFFIAFKDSPAAKADVASVLEQIMVYIRQTVISGADRLMV